MCFFLSRSFFSLNIPVLFRFQKCPPVNQNVFFSSHLHILRQRFGRFFREPRCFSQNDRVRPPDLTPTYAACQGGASLYSHPGQRFFSLFVKFRELEKTMQLFADPADGEIGICSVGERDKDSPVDMLKAIKPYGTEEEQSSIDLVLNFIEGSRLYESYWQNMPQTASFPTSQDIQNDSPNSDAVPASVLYPQAEYSRRQKEPTDRASGTSTLNRQEAHTMEFQNWKQDPRLRSMDPDKIKQMEQLADQARNTPQDKLLPLLMSLRGATVPLNSQPQKWTLFFRS